MLFRSFLGTLSALLHLVGAMFLLACWHWLGTPVQFTAFDVMSFESLMVAIAILIGFMHGYGHPSLGRTDLKTSMVRSAIAETAMLLWLLMALGGMVLTALSAPTALGVSLLCLVPAGLWSVVARKDNRTFENLLAQRGAAMFSLSS